MSERPRIGVTSWEDVPPDVRERYRARVDEAGGAVIDLDESSAADIAALASTLDGLVLTGGIDVDPSKYGATRHAKVKETAPGRDDMELAALDAALARDIPVLAICRGHQLMNVGFGGALLQHIDSGDHRADFSVEGYPSRWHEVDVERDSKLFDVFGDARFEINSRHHQAVERSTLAPGLRPIAFAADHGGELIEAVESPSHRWVVGVQWHPERPESHKPDFAPMMRRLFEAFVRQTGGNRH